MEHYDWPGQDEGSTGAARAIKSSFSIPQHQEDTGGTQIAVAHIH